jgi:hypothetical protein
VRKIGYASLGAARKPMMNVESPVNSEENRMLRIVRKTVGGALALLCLASTLALAQTQTMTCSASDGKGNCTVAMMDNGKSIVVVGKGYKWETK